MTDRETGPKTAASEVYGNGYYKPGNLEAGTPVVGEMNPIMQSCFAMVTRGPVRHILGNNDEPHKIEAKGEY